MQTGTSNYLPYPYFTAGSGDSFISVAVIEDLYRIEGASTRANQRFNLFSVGNDSALQEQQYVMVRRIPGKERQF